MTRAMEQRLTENDGRIALRDHVLARAAVARARYGGVVGWTELLAMLEDRQVVRFSTAVVFTATGLLAGEFAHAEMAGDRAAQGYRILVHPSFEGRVDLLPLLVAYHLVRVNYGDIATAADAELFGATLLGLDVEEYYRALCEASDSVAGSCGGGTDVAVQR